MVRIVRETDKTPIDDVIKKHGISRQTLYVWKRKFSGMDVDDARKLRALEQENAKLQKLLAEKLLDIEVLKDINKKKNGERARPSEAGGPCARALEAVAPTGVRSPQCCAFRIEVGVEERGRRRARYGADARARRAIPTLRLPAHSHLPRARTQHERRSCVPPMASRGASGAS